jgi:Zn-dependent protease/CBS domain-containing protein
VTAVAGQGDRRREHQSAEQRPLPSGTVPLGRIRGIRIATNWSVAVIFALIAVGLGTLQFPSANPRQSAATYALASVITTIVFFASLLAHELAHSLVARHYRLTVESITLFLFGGVSQLSGEVPSPSAEVAIAGVGPLTSLLLGGVFVGGAALLAGTSPARASLPGVVLTSLAYLGFTNLALAVFNIIPAAPLDGGRLLQAVVWWRTGDRVRATIWASRVGQVLGWVFIAGGLYAFFATENFSWVWIALIGWFVTSGATAEARQAVVIGELRGIRVGQIMTPQPATVPASMPVISFLDGYFFRVRHQSFPVTNDSQDKVTGLVTLNRIREVPAARREQTLLGDIACPLSDVATASPDESVADLIPRLTACSDQRALVFRDGNLVGIVSPTDITRMLDRLHAAQH